MTSAKLIPLRRNRAASTARSPAASVDENNGQVLSAEDASSLPDPRIHALLQQALSARVTQSNWADTEPCLEPEGCDVRKSVVVDKRELTQKFLLGDIAGSIHKGACNR